MGNVQFCNYFQLIFINEQPTSIHVPPRSANSTTSGWRCWASWLLEMKLRTPAWARALLRLDLNWSPMNTMQLSRLWNDFMTTIKFGTAQPSQAMFFFSESDVDLAVGRSVAFKRWKPLEINIFTKRQLAELEFFFAQFEQTSCPAVYLARTGFGRLNAFELHQNLWNQPPTK